MIIKNTLFLATWNRVTDRLYWEY